MVGNFSGLIRYAAGIIIHPVTSLRELCRDRNKHLYAFTTVTLFAFLYAVGSIIGYLTDAVPYGWEPLIKVPLDRFYLWQSIYLIPVTISTWILLAGCVQIISKVFHGEGTFEDTLAMLGLPFFVLVPGMFLPDCVVGMLPSDVIQPPVFWNVINPARLIVGTLWPVIIHILAVKEVQRLSFSRACIVTAFSYIPYGAVLLTYVH